MDGIGEVFQMKKGEILNGTIPRLPNCSLGSGPKSRALEILPERHLGLGVLIAQKNPRGTRRFPLPLG